MIYPKALVTHPPIHTRIETQKIIGKLGHLSRSAPILDFGAGTGRLTLPLIRAGFAPDVVEPDEISKNILKTIIPKNIKIYSQIPDKKYAAIVGTDVLHHIDLNKFLPLFYDHLNSGGVVCFSEPNGHCPLWYIQPQVFLYWNLEKGLVKITKNNMKNILKTSGFTNISVSGFWLNYRLLVFARRKK